MRESRQFSVPLCYRIVAFYIHGARDGWFALSDIAMVSRSVTPVCMITEYRLSRRMLWALSCERAAMSLC